MKDLIKKIELSDHVIQLSITADSVSLLVIPKKRKCTILRLDNNDINEENLFNQTQSATKLIVLVQCYVLALTRTKSNEKFIMEEIKSRLGDN